MFHAYFSPALFELDNGHKSDLVEDYLRSANDQPIRLVLLEGAKRRKFTQWLRPLHRTMLRLQMEKMQLPPIGKSLSACSTPTALDI